MIPESVIEEIKYRCNITDVISQYVTLKRAGSNMTGLCPFHSEKTPSFTVFEGSRSFYCFGCGAGGDVISFIMRAENMEYPEAVEYLARRAGIDVPQDGARRDNAGPAKQRLLDMNRAAAKFFYSQMKESKAALGYLEKRRITPALANHFGLGYAPDDFGLLTNHMHKLGFTDDELYAGFLCGKSKKTGRAYDYFRNRLMFPIINTSGDVIGFSGRVIGDGEPKYLNTSDTAVFKKSRNLFAMNFAKPVCRERLILCEGNIDVVSLHGAGFAYSVATLGTALTDDQARMMKRTTDEVVISYDNDAAGQKAANRAFERLREAGVTARVLVLEGAKDPDEYINTFGADAFRKLLDETYSEFDYKFLNILKKYDIRADEGRIAASNETVEVISSIYSSVERELYAKKAAAKLGVSSESLMHDVRAAVRRRSRQSKRDETETMKRRIQGLGDRVNPDRIKNLGGSAAEEAILGIMMSSPEFIAKAKDGEYGLTPDDFVTSLDRRIYEKMLEYGEGFDVGRLNGEFTADEVSRAAQMQVRRMGLANTEDALRDCVAALKRSASKNASIEDIIKNKRKQ
ncbi:MAG: DNA primase [Clostridia bacterium]|nr:DNA primase [Clostridia bacterium]